MAIINCSECGREISSTANRCPYCGKATASYEVNTSKLAVILGTLPFDIGGAVLLIIGLVRLSEDESEEALIMLVLGVVILLVGLIANASLMSSIRKKEQELQMEQMLADEQNGDAVTRMKGKGATKNGAVVCPMCGTSVYRGDKCTVCGFDFRKLLEMVENSPEYEGDKVRTYPKQDRKKVCSKCGYTFREDCNFCENCGNKIR